MDSQCSECMQDILITNEVVYTVMFMQLIKMLQMIKYENLYDNEFEGKLCFFYNDFVYFNGFFFFMLRVH